MRGTLTLVAVLTLVCSISALTLALINNITAPRIIEQKRLAKLNAVMSAIPREQVGYDNDPSKDIMTIDEWKDKNGLPKEVYLAKRKGEVAGVAFTSTGEGYGGFVTLMMGVDLDGKLTGIDIVEHMETPGLGAGIEDPEKFEGQFRGKSPQRSQTGGLIVVKGRKAGEDWEIEAITGATISSRGVVNAINEGLENFRKYKDKIMAE